MPILLTTLVVSFLLSVVLTPLAIRLAWRIGYLDHPEARKLHTSATALLGGVSIFFSALIAWLAVAIGRYGDPSHDVIFLLIGAMIALVLGMRDDAYGMHPIVKLIGQGAAAGILLASGAVPDLHLGPIGNVAVTVVALVGLMNAINFLDNMNGMVAGSAAIALLAFAYGSYARGAIGIASAQLALAGACLGFLRYNFPTARIFLGDAGSLFLG